MEAPKNGEGRTDKQLIFNIQSTMTVVSGQRGGGGGGTGGGGQYLLSRVREV